MEFASMQWPVGQQAREPRNKTGKQGTGEGTCKPEERLKSYDCFHACFLW